MPIDFKIIDATPRSIPAVEMEIGSWGVTSGNMIIFRGNVSAFFAWPNGAVLNQYTTIDLQMNGIKVVPCKAQITLTKVG